MFTTVSVSVQEFRGIRTASTTGTSSYRDFQRLPATKTNYKRQYLKGASNRVKSLKEESHFVQLCNERKGNEKLFKFNRQDQLLNYRNLHLNKLQPISNQEQNLENQQNQEQQNKSQINSPNNNLRSSALQLITDQKNQLIELIYNAQPVIQKQKRTYSNQQKTEYLQNGKIHTQITGSSPKAIKNQPQILGQLIVSSRNKNDLFVKSTQLTSYGSLKITTQEDKLSIPPKPKIPISLDGAKKFLKQFI
ncbi:unnamed protein product [Paramecium primaurelia]|uniref:Uncharacterized protein n=1 Tax=Paramecium primaurelia TaxID=5886 RepID=A0A8S1NJ28_PARPR|nr:unnamed protein product [Paramecium primaurelia]